ncbi:MAG: hypothetical protein K6T66_13925 [Peptococcaceae bacterium]|jgi:hypothetical protein|nr:hypothetical protein [Peptococcaceae bacterium]
MPEKNAGAAAEDKKKTATQDSGEEMFTIEDLAERLRVPVWVMAGLKAAYGWGEGKMLTESQFVKEKDAWLARPMEGVRK